METISSCQSLFRPASQSATRAAAAVVGDHAARKRMDLEKVARGVRLILEGVGEDPDREGLQETPARVARMFGELLYGTHSSPASEITVTFDEQQVDDMVLVKDIQFSSTCEHHLVPFVGVAHLAYQPLEGRITGLSKLARVVELASRRLQVQERLTGEVADALVEQLSPAGVIVVVEAEHFCMSIRGVRKPGSKTITTAARGVFKTDRQRRAEVFSLLRT